MKPKHNLSVCVGIVNTAESPSTTANVTQWVGSYDEYMVLCDKVWSLVVNDDYEVLQVGLLTGSDC